MGYFSINPAFFNEIMTLNGLVFLYDIDFKVNYERGCNNFFQINKK